MRSKPSRSAACAEVLPADKPSKDLVAGLVSKASTLESKFHCHGICINSICVPETALVTSSDHATPSKCKRPHQAWQHLCKQRLRSARPRRPAPARPLRPTATRTRPPPRRAPAAERPAAARRPAACCTCSGAPPPRRARPGPPENTGPGVIFPVSHTCTIVMKYKSQGRACPRACNSADSATHCAQIGTKYILAAKVRPRESSWAMGWIRWGGFLCKKVPFVCTCRALTEQAQCTCQLYRTAADTEHLPQ